MSSKSVISSKSISIRDQRPRRPPKEDFDEVLKMHMTIPSREPGSHCETVISDESFISIGRTLQHHGDEYIATHGPERPRIYTILHHIDRIDVFRSFVEAGITDFEIPIPEGELPGSLGPNRSAFVQKQKHCLTDASEVEKGKNGRHLHCNSSPPYFLSIRNLGSDGFGHVDVVWSRLSLRQYARKRFPRGSNTREASEMFENYKREVGALKKLSHKHLVNIKGTYSDPFSFALLMDPVADCDLEVYLDRLRDEHRATLRTFFGCLTTALVYLHSHELLHLNIKPSNVLIKAGNIFMADFGPSHDWSARVRSTTWSSRPPTLPYMPPERENNLHAPCNTATDIWSLGVVFLEMLSVLRGTRPTQFKEYLRGKGTQQPFVWNNLPGTMSWLELLRIQSGPDYDNIPETWVKDMLAREPHKRPFSTHLRHLIREAGQFCGLCCASFDQPDDFREGMDFRFTYHHRSLSDRGLDDDVDEKYEEPGLNPAKTGSIEDWLQHTDLATARASNMKEQIGSFELNILEDDDIPVASASGEQEYLKHTSQRISGLDLFAGFNDPGSQSKEAPFSVGAKPEDRDDVGSDSVLELQSTLDSQILPPITRQLSLFDQEDDDEQKNEDDVLAVIEEESASASEMRTLHRSTVGVSKRRQRLYLPGSPLQEKARSLRAPSVSIGLSADDTGSVNSGELVPLTFPGFQGTSA